jgi:hypothetical protein
MTVLVPARERRGKRGRKSEKQKDEKQHGSVSLSFGKEISTNPTER